MDKHLIEAGLWAAAGLVWWLVPPPWKNLWYLLMGAAVGVSVWGYFDSRRRLKKASEAVDRAKKEVERIRKELS